MFPVSKKECNKIYELFVLCSITQDKEAKNMCNKVDIVMKQANTTLMDFYVKCMIQPDKTT